MTVMKCEEALPVAVSLLLPHRAKTTYVLVPMSLVIACFSIRDRVVC